MKASWNAVSAIRCPTRNQGPITITFANNIGDDALLSIMDQHAEPEDPRVIVIESENDDDSEYVDSD